MKEQSSIPANGHRPLAGTSWRTLWSRSSDPRAGVCLAAWLPFLFFSAVPQGQAMVNGFSSASGQFIVSPAARTHPPAFAANKNFIVLEPTLLAVSCERIKKALDNALGTGAEWDGRIYLSLHPARSPNETGIALSERISSHWMYRLALPDVMEKSRFVRAVVQVLLVEMANRNGGSHSADVPAWLAEGLAQELLAREGPEILLQPPDQTENGVNIRRVALDARRTNSVDQVLANLGQRPPLTYEQLSWPGVGQLTGPDSSVYRCSAQLFVHQLLRLKDGPACLQAMLRALPRCYNWQFALLAGFHPYFQTQLDVEKWWALQVVQFTGRDLTQNWTQEQSWKKLEDIILTPADVRAKPDELPTQKIVSLQTLIKELDAAQCVSLLRRKLQQLNFLRLRAAQNVVPVVDDYRTAIEMFLEKQPATTRPGLFSRTENPARRQIVAQTIAELNALDAKTAALRSLARTPVPDGGQTATNTAR